MADWPRRDLAGFLAAWPANPLELLALPGVDDAAHEIEREAAAQFDPGLVPPFLGSLHAAP